MYLNGCWKSNQNGRKKKSNCITLSQISVLFLRQKCLFNIKFYCMKKIRLTTRFAEDVLKGLSSTPKYLSSKYFYDDEGSRIFQKIMQMPEYYLTDCELEIFQKQRQKIYELFALNSKSFDLIELGAGDGIKTAILLEHFVGQDAAFEYMPIDISGEVVSKLTQMMSNRLPSLKINGKTGDYFEMMDAINRYDHCKKVLLFLGSNIGNFNEQEAHSFLVKLHAAMQKNDLLFIGFDLKKDSNVILKAYNDPQGYTAAFNLNLLKRMNRELRADFYLDNFEHEEFYDVATGRAESYLFSLKKQMVNFPDFHRNITFEKGESVFMEMSQKYDLEMINEMAKNSGFEVVRNFHDSRLYYVNSLWKVRTR